MSRNTAFAVTIVAFFAAITVVPIIQTFDGSKQLQIKQLELRIKELELEIAKCTQGKNHETKTFNHSTDR